MPMQSWQNNLKLEDLFYAYRKAKTDTFFDRSTFRKLWFSTYEKNLENNLGQLLKRIKSTGVHKVLQSQIGFPKIFPKAVEIGHKSECNNRPGFYFTNPQASVSNDLLSEDKEVSLSFRAVGHFPVEVHILSALWINQVGHKLDAVLNSSVRANRVRRFRQKPYDNEKIGSYHREAIGSFPHYSHAYRKWQRDGFNCVRQALDNGDKLLVVSLDLTSYYHSLNPNFLQCDDFWDSINAPGISDEEMEFTKIFSNFLLGWSTRVGEVFYGKEGGKNFNAGLPIDLTFSRVAANIFLHEFDNQILTGLTPEYYGRYVDDLFIVLKDPGNIVDESDFWKFITSRTNAFKVDGSGHYLSRTKNYQLSSRIAVNGSKKKVFFVDPQTGKDFVDTIEKHIRDVASERNIMMSPDDLEKSQSHHVLTSQESPSLGGESLSKSTDLTVKRIAWTIQLNNFERYSRDLDPAAWKSKRKRFYELTRRYILSPQTLFDYHGAFYRVFSLAVASRDWTEALHLYKVYFRSWEQLSGRKKALLIELNGKEVTRVGAVKGIFKEFVRTQLREALFTSLPLDLNGGNNEPGYQELLKCFFVQKHSLNKSVNDLYRADLARKPFKASMLTQPTKLLDFKFTRSALQAQYKYKEGLGAFRVQFENKIETTNKLAKISLNTLLFPTRPLTPQEIALLLPEASVFNKNSAVNLADFTRGLRGAWIGPAAIVNSPSSQKNHQFAIVGRSDRPSKIRLGIAGLRIADSTYVAGASNAHNLSLQRYQQISRIVTKAIRANPRPDYLILPELALPAQWIASASQLLTKHGISLISGVDYIHSDGNTVHSEVAMVLTDNRFGYPTAIQIRQPKLRPAPGEKDHLRRKYKKTWNESVANGLRQHNSPQAAKPVYIHNGFSFGALVCSELQNIEYRKDFRGAVDALIVVAWNQDLETFSALVEGAALDVHAYTILVNNLRYGDSRIRSPAKERYLRDVCRLRGGLNDHLIVAEIDVADLRDFQSKAESLGPGNKNFKPVPDGFSIADFRRVTPK